MFPRSKNEEATFGTGSEVLMAWFGEGVEPPRSEEDERKMGIKGCAHDGLFAFGDGGGDKDGSLPGFCKEESDCFFHLLFCQASGALYLQFLWGVEKKLIADSGVGLSCYADAETDTKEVGVLAFD